MIITPSLCFYDANCFILNDLTQEFGATGSVSGALTSIVYTTESGTTVDITGTDKADALVMAR